MDVYYNSEHNIINMKPYNKKYNNVSPYTNNEKKDNSNNDLSNNNNIFKYVMILIVILGVNYFLSLYYIFNNLNNTYLFHATISLLIVILFFKIRTVSLIFNFIIKSIYLLLIELKILILSIFYELCNITKRNGNDVKKLYSDNA